MEDRIEKQIELKAPVSRVWRALTDYREFSEWFRVKLESPFVAGEETSGNITFPGYEHLRMEVRVQEMEPERLFSFTWHPAAIEKGVDYSGERPTLVEFRLESNGADTILRVTESGFQNLPGARALDAFRKNTSGWAQQLKSIEDYVASA